MPLRRRLTVALAAAVAVAVALACVVAYLAVRGELRSQIDDALTAQVAMPRFGGGPPPDNFRVLPARRGGPTPYIQLVGSDGSVATRGSEDAELPVDAHTRSVAAGDSSQYFSDAKVDGVHVRMLTAPLIDGVALQVGRSLDST